MRFSFDAVANRYRDAKTGRFVSEAAVRGAIDSALDVGTRQMIDITKQLQSGKLALAEWQPQMMAAIKQTHIAAGIAAHGGVAEMSPARYGFLGSEIKKQYEYLRNWTAEIASGKAPLDGRMLVRAELYGQAARGTAEDIRRREMRQRAENQERRVRAAKDSCATCISQAALGWQSLGTLNRIGDSECVTRCKCTFRFRVADLAAEAA